ncbi:unnamed protein product [Lasius platythorax]|uniref:Uncharacterized protein n=1 Tax=Lasius platythorax TaxID=488582 RepID=A0AAV2MZA3_9HYME
MRRGGKVACGGATERFMDHVRGPCVALDQLRVFNSEVTESSVSKKRVERRKDSVKVRVIVEEEAERGGGNRQKEDRR